VRYDLDARLDPEAHVVTAKGVMAWTSDAKVPVDAVRLHLYLNAFRDEKSAFMREAHGDRRTRFDPRRAGSIEITRLARPGGPDLVEKIRWAHCDGVSEDDRTVAEVPLDVPVQPGEEAVFEVAFTSRLPRIVARTGFGGDFHMVAQWFPKFGVWQDPGEGGAEVAGWNCHAFHANTEFFADYGVYDVRVTVPESYRGQVGATGAPDPKGPRTGADGTVTYAFHAEDVHDFAWVAGRNASVHTVTFPGGRGTDRDGRETQRVATILGRSPVDLALPQVQVTFLLRPEHEEQFDRHRRAVFEALTYMGLWFGPYPYPTLTVVDPDFRGRGSGGMEYPTLITGGTGHVLAPRGIDPEFVLVHEFGHQHFYGLLASNEFEDAWMDEGFNTYGTAKVLETAYGPRAMTSYRWWLGHPVAGEPPLEFAGVLGGLPKSMPWLAEESVPFGRIGLVAAIGRAFGGQAPDKVTPWPVARDPGPVEWLRDLPPLTYVDVLDHTVGEHERSRYAEWPDTDSLSGRAGWRYLDGRAYGTQSYRRTANVLRTLEGWLGEETMVRVMRTYAERFRFRHPTPADFEATASEVAGQDLKWFFDGLVRDSQVLDFGVHEIANGEKEPDGTLESTVTVRRYGGARFPTTVRVGFEDGTARTLRWGLDDRVTSLDGGPLPATSAPPESQQYRWVKLRFRGTSPVAVAETDPERRVSLEVDRTNDGRRAETDSRPSLRLAIRVLGWVEQWTTFYGGL
jgi:hypothetical protein